MDGLGTLIAIVSLATALVLQTIASLWKWAEIMRLMGRQQETIACMHLAGTGSAMERAYGSRHARRERPAPDEGPWTPPQGGPAPQAEPAEPAEQGFGRDHHLGNAMPGMGVPAAPEIKASG